MSTTTTQPSNALLDVFTNDKSIPSAKDLEKLDDADLKTGIGKGVLALKQNEDAWDNYLIATFMAVRVIRDRAKTNAKTGKKAEAAKKAVNDLNLPWSDSYVTKMLSFVKDGTAKAGLKALRKWKDQKTENASKRKVGTQNQSGGASSTTAPASTATDTEIQPSEDEAGKSNDVREEVGSLIKLINVKLGKSDDYLASVAQHLSEAKERVLSGEDEWRYKKDWPFFIHANFMFSVQWANKLIQMHKDGDFRTNLRKQRQAGDDGARKHIGAADLTTLYDALSNEDRLDFLKAAISKLSDDERHALLDAATAPPATPTAALEKAINPAASTVDPDKEKKAA